MVTNSLAFTNVLGSGQLKATGDKLNGTVIVTDNPLVKVTASLDEELVFLILFLCLFVRQVSLF